MSATASLPTLPPLAIEGVETLSEHACFGGTQGFYRHASSAIGLPMRFGVYRPPQSAQGPVPVLFYLAGLTCNEETFAIKAGAQRAAAELGLMLVTPDTSPRDTGVAGADEAWDFGTAAGFYLDATQPPWNRHWRMESYITRELHTLVMKHFPADASRVGIFGHSMGGHGALSLALKHPELFHSVSAFAPVCAPRQSPWGRKAFGNYLGQEAAAWASHDTCALLESGKRCSMMLVDQGLADKFLREQLQPERLETACAATGQPLTLRRHAGHDHGYYFVATFMESHLRHHTQVLAARLRP